MAIKTFDELLTKLKEHIGDKNDDDTLGFIEDFSDTFKNYENTENEDWKKKYEDNDKMWRNRYRERFFSADVEEEKPEDFAPPDEIKPLSYDNLFKEEKK